MVGGGAAGLSAALVLGRARRNDAARRRRRPEQPAPRTASAGCSARTAARRPSSTRTGASELAAYPCGRAARRRGDRRPPRRRPLRARAGRRRSRRGAPHRARHRHGIPPAADRPARRAAGADTVFHCPFCHGWEVRDQPLAVLARRRAGRPSRCTCCAAGATTSSWLDPSRPISDCVAENGKLAAIEFEDGETLPRAALLVAVDASTSAPTSHEQLGAALDRRRLARRRREPRHDRARRVSPPATSPASRTARRRRDRLPVSWLPRWSCERDRLAAGCPTAVQELELPEFEYLNPELKGERFHEELKQLRETGWLASMPLGFVVLDREAASSSCAAAASRSPG